MSDFEPDEILDQSGVLRRCGSMQKPVGFVSSFKTFEAEKPIYTRAERLKMLKDPERKPLRKIFGDDWISNQASTSACNGHAGANALSKARRMRGITDGLRLSGAFLYSLINGGRDQGSMLEDGMKALVEYGCCPESLVPPNQIFPSQQPRNARKEALKRKGFLCYPCETQDGFWSALLAGFPVIVAVHAGRNFQRLDSKGIAGVDNGPGNHAIHSYDVELIGNDETAVTDNSWGLQYGTQGACNLRWASFEQTFRNHMFYAIASTEESDE